MRNQQGEMVPLGTIVKIEPVVGAPLISLYNLYPSSSVIGLPAAGFSSGQAIRLMEEDVAHTLPPGMGSEWTAMSYQEKLVGKQETRRRERIWNCCASTTIFTRRSASSS